MTLGIRSLDCFEGSSLHSFASRLGFSLRSFPWLQFFRSFRTRQNKQAQPFCFSSLGTRMRRIDHHSSPQPNQAKRNKQTVKHQASNPPNLPNQKETKNKPNQTHPGPTTNPKPSPSQASQPNPVLGNGQAQAPEAAGDQLAARGLQLRGARRHRRQAQPRHAPLALGAEPEEQKPSSRATSLAP